MALNKAGITGMTVTPGHGLRPAEGQPARCYRGVEVDATPAAQGQGRDRRQQDPGAQRIIDAAKQVLYTGHIGDGKIFVYSVEKVVKVRTGEEDLLALTDEAEE